MKKSENGNTGYALKQTGKGGYAWKYDLNLFKNYFVFSYLFKVVSLIIIGVFIFVSLFSLSSKDVAETMLFNAKIFAIVYGVAIAVSFAGYFFYARAVEGVYLYEYEMDESGIRIVQSLKNSDKVKKKSFGLNPFLASIKNNATAKIITEIKFSDVKKAKFFKKGKIRLRDKREHTLFANGEDFKLIKDFIIEKCDARS